MKAEFFAQNRERLAAKMPGSIIVATAYHELQMLHDQAHVFRQNSSFWYLCGIEEPSWRLIIDTKRHKSYAVQPVRSDTKVLFDGGLSASDAKAISDVDEVIDSDEAESLLRQLRREHRMVYMVEEDEQVKKYAGFHMNPAHKELKKFLSHRFESVRGAYEHVADLRAIKQPEEIAALKKAAKLSADAFTIIAKDRDAFRYEHEIEARFGYEFRMHGADGHAYQPIVASGANACTLHYIQNNQKLRARSALLIDAGARVDNYSADISRTLMIGSPTKRQTAVYDAVKEVFAACLRQLKPGTSLRELQMTANRETARVLGDLGLGNDETSVRRYFPHAIGHSLGVDVHDCFGAYEELREGMVLTVEPGLYIAEESIGVRYEDDFVITSSGAINLTGARMKDLWYNEP